VPRSNSHGRYVGHIPCIRLVVAKHLAKIFDVEAQAALFDIHISPDIFKKFVLRNDFACALDEDNEKVERSATDAKRSAVFFQAALRRQEAERART